MFHVPDWLAERNVASWGNLVAFYDRVLGNGWASVERLRRLVREVAGSEWARWFRAGQSVHTMMVSTAAGYGLEEGDPFVSVSATTGGDGLLIGYHYSGLGDRTAVEHLCTEADVLRELTALLTRLGNDPNGLPARWRRRERKVVESTLDDWNPVEDEG